jgi:hypothetical protein
VKQREDLEEILSEIGGKTGNERDVPLEPNERELLREVVRGIQDMRYGSISLVIHEGRLVEVSKTVRIRKSRANQNERA